MQLIILQTCVICQRIMCTTHNSVTNEIKNNARFGVVSLINEELAHQLNTMEQTTPQTKDKYFSSIEECSQCIMPFQFVYDAFQNIKRKANTVSLCQL